MKAVTLPSLARPMRMPGLNARLFFRIRLVIRLRKGMSCGRCRLRSAGRTCFHSAMKIPFLVEDLDAIVAASATKIRP